MSLAAYSDAASLLARMKHDDDRRLAEGWIEADWFARPDYVAHMIESVL